MKIKEVIFDIDGTIYSYEKGHPAGMDCVAAYAKENFGKDPEEFREAYTRLSRKALERLGSDNAAIHSRSIRIQNILEEWKVPLFPHVRKMYRLYWDSLLEACGTEPGCLEAVRALHEQGITIGVGTDMTAWMQYEKLEHFGLAPYISHMVTSQEAGYEKPHPEFMKLCLEKAGFEPQECVFVGDSFKKDVAGAVQAGMHAVWYNQAGKKRPEDVDLPSGSYREIHHFDELVSCISSLETGR